MRPLDPVITDLNMSFTTSSSPSCGVPFSNSAPTHNHDFLQSAIVGDDDGNFIHSTHNTNCLLPCTHNFFFKFSFLTQPNPTQPNPTQPKIPSLNVHNLLVPSFSVQSILAFTKQFELKIIVVLRYLSSRPYNNFYFETCGVRAYTV